jgi:hypothetical protein
MNIDWKICHNPDPTIEKRINLAVIDKFKIFYEKEGHNPLFVFKAYQIARENGLEVPDWVYQYFDNSINNLDNLINGFISKRTDKKSIEVFAEAFNIARQGEARLITKYNDKLIKLAVCLKIELLKENKPKKSYDDIYEEIANTSLQEWGVKLAANTIRNWRQNFKKYTG